LLEGVGGFLLFLGVERAVLLYLLAELAQLVEELVPVLAGWLVSWFCHEEGSRAGLSA
jgi:hypothetical protein